MGTFDILYKTMNSLYEIHRKQYFSKITRNDIRIGEIVNPQNVSLPKNNFPKCQPIHQMTEMLWLRYFWHVYFFAMFKLW